MAREITPRRRKQFQILILALAAAFVAIGAFHGEAFAVFQKASRICLECIGIG